MSKLLNGIQHTQENILNLHTVGYLSLMKFCVKHRHFRAIKLIPSRSNCVEMFILKEHHILKAIYLMKKHGNNELSKVNRNKERTEFILLLIFINSAKGSRNSEG